MVTVEQLYKNFGVLADAKDKAGEHTKEYQEILSAAKGEPNVKRLASQFIARFFKYFPSLAEQALDCQFDLCEDNDINIRKQAIKDLPLLCKDSHAHLPRIADVLTQLLQTDDPSEASLVQSSLLLLLRADPRGALDGIFTQILEGDEIVRERAIKFMATKLRTLPEDLWTKEAEEVLVTESKKILEGDEIVRERAIKFMATKLRTLPEDLWTKEAEEVLVTESKKVLLDVTGDEFISFMKILPHVKSMSTLQGRLQLVDIVADQADLDKPFEATDSDNVDRVVQCVRQAMPLFSKNVHSDKFVEYFCDQVIPVLYNVSQPEPETLLDNGEKSDKKPDTVPEIHLELLKLFSELTFYCGEITDPENKVKVIFDKLIGYMPLPPPEDKEENTESNSEPYLQFSFVECLMYAFHQLARRCPEYLTDDKNADRLKDFRLRLQYFARGVQVYIKQLRMALQENRGENLKTEENKIKVVALKTTNNINTLIKDLFHNPPSYKASCTLSWKPFVQKTQQENATGQKRSGITPITYDTDAPKKASRSDIRRYTPPGGKFSEKAGTYPNIRGRGRGAFRGGRGRGRGGNWGGLTRR